MARERRQQIIDVAADLFAERGFHGVTVDDIGAAVGVTGRALYHHFSGKEELLGHMLVDISQRLLHGGLKRSASTSDPTAALHALIAFHVEFAITQPSLITVHFRDLVHAPQEHLAEVRRLQGEYVEVWVGVLTRAVTGLDRRTARASVYAVLGLLNSTPYSARIGRDAMRHMLTRMATAALGAAPASPG